MKKEICSKILRETIEKVISTNVNSACWFVFHQPKLPSGTEKFKKN